MSKVRSTLLFVIFLSAVALSASQDAFAQWATSASSPGYNMTCVRFLQAENAREPNPIPNPLNTTPFHHGLFGGGDAGGTRGISYIRSSDPGWAAATVPAFWTDGYISDFSFEDTLVGYASIYGAAQGFYFPLVSGIMKTTDGGATWNFLTSAPPEVRGLFYDWTNQRLYCSSGGIDDIGGGAMSGAWVSTNHGVDWTRINIPNPVNNTLAHWCYYTGFASWNDKDIVLATEGSPNPCTDAGFPAQTPFWLQSHDGGLTWSTSSMYSRSMQPVALKGTQTFFATTGNPSSAMFSSNDNGNVWRTVQGFTPLPASYATECMGGDPCLIVAGDSSVSGGVLFSIDDGGSWVPLSGGPATPIDLRFYVGSDSIWAYTKHQLQSIARPAPKPIHIFPNAINFAKSGCFTADTVVQLYGCDCGNATLVSDSLQKWPSWGTAADTNKFKISSNSGGAPWPVPPLTHNFCRADSAHIQYTPNGPNPDTVIAHLIIRNNGINVDTTIVVSGNGAPAGFTSNWRWNGPIVLYGPGHTTAKACQEIDTDLCFYNTTCSDDIITKIWVDGPDNWTVYQVEQLSTPITLLAKVGQQCIHVRALSSGESTPTGFQITIYVTINGTEYPFRLQMGVIGKIPPYVTSFHLKDPYPCPHPGTSDTAIFYWDTTCRSVKIANIKHINITDFALDDSIVAKAKRGELYVYPQDSTGPGKTFYFKLPIKLLTSRPGKYIDTIEFIDSMSDGTFVHTFVGVSYEILGAISLKPNGPLSLKFGCISPCDSARVIFPLKIQNPCNFDVTISNYDETGKGLYTVTRHPTKGQVLKVGTSDTIIVEWPFGATTNPPNGFVLVTYMHGDAIHGYDSTIVRYDFSGTACPGVNAIIRPANNMLGSVRFACDSADALDSIINISCQVDAKISSITVLSGRNIVVSPKPGDLIPSGTSIPLHLRFVPLPGDADTICGTVVLFVTNTTGAVVGVNDTVTWCVDILKTFPSLSVTSIAKTDSVACGQTWDTTICIKNTATCGKPIIITNAQQTSTGVTITGNFPVTIQPDSTFCFTATFVPPLTGPGSIAGQINVTGDTSFSVPYNIPYQACSTNDTILFQPNPVDSTIVTANCVDGKIVYNISVIGKSRAVNFTLAGSPNFHQSSNFALPHTVAAGETLADTVIYGPVFNDVSTATLTISVDGVQRTITLTGRANGVPAVAHVGIELPPAGTHSAVLPLHPTQATQDIDIMLRDAIAAGTGLTTTTVTLDFTNYDILTVISVTNGAWTWSSGSLPTMGAVPLTFTVPPGAYAAGTKIATVHALVSLGASNTTIISVKSAHYNDANFETCTLGGLPATDLIYDTVALAICNDSLIMKGLGGILDGSKDLRIVPNPAHKSEGSAASLQFTTVLSADATVDLLDLSGKQVAELSRGTLAKGDHALAIPTANLAEGTYFARIQIGGFTVVRKFVIEKE